VVTESAFCGSVFHFWFGEMPVIPDFILGHEFVAKITAIGPGVKRFKVNDRVAVPAIPYCGTCAACKRGDHHQCSESIMFGWRTRMGNLAGAQAEFVRVPHADACLVSIPDTVSDKKALFVGDILSTAYFGVTNGQPQPGDDIVIFGAGPVGLCAVACARLYTPSRILLVDLEEYRLDMGKRLGASHVLNPKEVDVVKEIRRITNKRGADICLDAVGLPSTLDQSTRAVKAGGVVSIIGIGPAKFEVNMGRVFMKNITLKTGVVPLDDMDRLMKLIEFNLLNLEPIITHELPLSQIIDGYKLFAEHRDQCIKVMVVPD
jgi:alcohol dehydrogenase